MAAIINGAPMDYHRGAQDKSKGDVPVTPQEIPIHLPMIPMSMERGTFTPQLVGTNELKKIYGGISLEYREKFANHSTLLARTILAEGNKIFAKRIGVGTKTATIRLFAEIVADDIPDYTRNADGTYSRDVNGQPVSAGSDIPGFKLRYFAEEVPENDGINGFAIAVQRAGVLTGGTGETSTVYSILDAEVSSAGGFGDNVGFRLSAPTTLSPESTDEDLMLDQGAYVFRAQFVERADAQSTPKVKESLDSEQFVDFTFKPGTYDKKTNLEKGFDEVVVPSYQDLDDSDGTPPVWGPFGKIHFFEANFKTLVDKIATAEGAKTSTTITPWTVNPISCLNYSGAPYYTVVLDNTIPGSIRLTDVTTVYAQGGDDGDVSIDAFDTAVGEFWDQFETDPDHLMDQSKWPMRCVIDSGYSIETKKKLLVPMSLRKDIYTVLSTQDAAEDINNAAEERSIAIALRTAAAMYPESNYYGTPCNRAIIVGHCAEKRANVPYKGIVPLTIDLAGKCARYMGAGNGKFKSEEAFDLAPKNQVEGMIGVQNVYKPARSRIKDWDAGLCTIQQFDMTKLFYAGLQTVYMDDTSVMNNFFNMVIQSHLDYVCHQAWTLLSGISKLTKEQFIERSDKLILELTDGLYDERVVVVPRTFYTKLDDARGYSWSCEIHMYANNMKSVGVYSLVIHRREDLAG